VSDTVVHLLRHGKVHNPREILYGTLPGFPLAASGRAMAEGVAGHLAHADVTLLVASPLLRAQQTAEPLAAALHLPIVTDARIIEAGNDFEGRRVDLRAGTALVDPRSWVRLRNPMLPSWGEPYLQIARRMLAAVYDAVQRAAGHHAVLVTHQLPIVTIRRFLQGQRLWHDPRRLTDVVPLQRRRVPPCALQRAGRTHSRRQRSGTGRRRRHPRSARRARPARRAGRTAG
jgi:broad specificity phosphatase PhoE